VVADATPELDHALSAGAREWAHRVDRREQRRAPRRHPDDVAAGERHLQIQAQIVDDALVGGVERLDDLSRPVEN
jgi:hypothetical protein